jgi:hypothetical protein
MELRSLLKSGHSVALGVLALRAVQSALTAAMPTGGDSPPMGWTPMPDPADGGWRTVFRGLPDDDCPHSAAVGCCAAGSGEPFGGQPRSGMPPRASRK